MKTLFIGGIKSGKSRLAEDYILKDTTTKPYYLATTEFVDDELQQRIREHQQRRQDQFVTLEEPFQLLKCLSECSGPVLVECVSMWLNNMLYHHVSESVIMQELSGLLHLSIDIVFVQNEVGAGVIADNPLARQYVDLSGKAAQLIAKKCDHVYFCCAGISLKIK